jgi:hypothetical protein
MAHARSKGSEPEADSVPLHAHRHFTGQFLSSALEQNPGDGSAQGHGGGFEQIVNVGGGMDSTFFVLKAANAVYTPPRAQAAMTA